MGCRDRPRIQRRQVSVADVRVGHEVKLVDFTKWLEKPGGSPGEVTVW